MKQIFKLAPSCSLLLALGLALVIAGASPASAAPGQATARAPGKPGLKPLRRVPGFKLQEYRAHNTRYATNQGVQLSAVTPMVYDAKTRKLRTLPFLKRLAKRWYGARLVYYDPLKGAAGLLVDKRVGAAPNYTTCSCGAPYTRFPRSLILLCRRCNKYVRMSFKRPKKMQQYYVHVHLKTKRIQWKVKMTGTGLYPLGVDRAGNYFMAYRKQFLKKGRGTTQKVTLVRVSLRNKKVDWTHTVTFPTRTGPKYTNGNAMLYASTDLRKVLLREYDERSKSRPRGSLSSPRARGVIVHVGSSSQVSFTVPVSSYGAVFGSRNRYLYLTSHQLGRIYKIDTRTGRLIKSVYNGYGAFALLFSKTGRYLYCVHFSGVNVFDPVTLKRVKSIALGTLFPGNRKLLVVATHVALTSGDLLLAMVKKPKRGLRSVTALRGFVHFKVME